MLFRANAELYPSLSVVNFPQSSEAPTLNLPDFGLVNHYPKADYLGSSNLPSLLANVPAQDFFAYSSSLETGLENIAPKDDFPTWDSLWQGASRMSIAVPEPSSLALLGIGAFVLGARKLRPRK